jgi:Flp pilus assembly pilin Flp
MNRSVLARVSEFSLKAAVSLEHAVYRLKTRQEGLSTIEYTVLAAAILTVVVTLSGLLSGTINGAFLKMKDKIATLF